MNEEQPTLGDSTRPPDRVVVCDAIIDSVVDNTAYLTLTYGSDGHVLKQKFNYDELKAEGIGVGEKFVMKLVTQGCFFNIEIYPSEDKRR